MATFNWPLSYTPKLTRKPRVLTAQFGDGYSQRVGDGINSNPASWSLTFSARDKNEASAIVAFLDAQAGVTAFTWTDPTGTTASYICQDYGMSRTSPLSYEVTATFTEVFDPS